MFSLRNRGLFGIGVLFAFGATLLLVTATPAGSAPSLLCFGQPATLVGTPKSDDLQGTAGRDVIVGLGGRDTLAGLAGDDLLCGGRGRDSLYGSSGQDKLAGGAKRDWLEGNEGRDVLRGDGGSDAISGDEGQDDLAGNGGADRLNGGAGDDDLYGNAGNDSLRGDDDFQAKDTPRGDDLLAGGPGVDTALFWVSPKATRGMNVNLRKGVARGDGRDKLREIEGALAESEHADRLRGDAKDNVFSAGAGEDTFKGAGGDDRFIADRGDDSYAGGPGSDEIDFSDAFERVVVSLGSGSARGPGIDSLTDVENASGGYGDDILSGSNEANRLEGGEGEDTIRGGGGDDILRGGLNDLSRPDRVDRLSGGPGNDLIDGGSPKDRGRRGGFIDGRDEIDFSPAAQAVTVNLALGTATGEGTDTLVRVEDVTGSGFDDTIVGDSGPNEINAGVGQDDVDAAGGPDEIEGGPDDDQFAGGPGIDILEFNYSAAPVDVNLTAGTATGQGTDALSGFENVRGTIFDDVLVGTGGPNVVFGNLGDDVLTGGDGDDVIVGARGNDELHGDLGNDSVLGVAGDDQVDGGDGNDFLRGGQGDDTHTGGAGNDSMLDDGGNDSFAGDANTDKVSFALMPAAVVVDLVGGTAISEVSQETVATTENVIATRFPDEVLGDAANNVIVGLRGLDRLLGGDGNDRLQGGRGQDAMNGGTGTDVVSYWDSPRPVTVDLQGGFAEGWGSDTLGGFENIVGSNFSDYLRGDAVANPIFGIGSDDILEGREGNDFLSGGGGADSADGGAGTDGCVAADSKRPARPSRACPRRPRAGPPIRAARLVVPVPGCPRGRVGKAERRER